MTENTTPRWIQRFENYRNALRRLEEVIDRLNSSLPVDEITLGIFEDSIIQRFEFTQELAWKVMKDFLRYQGEEELIGSRDTFRRALKVGLIDSPEWMQTIEDRNLTSHKYDETIATGIGQRIRKTYLNLFQTLEADLMVRINDTTNS